MRLDLLFLLWLHFLVDIKATLAFSVKPFTLLCSIFSGVRKIRFAVVCETESILVVFVKCIVLFIIINLLLPSLYKFQEEDNSCIFGKEEWRILVCNRKGEYGFGDLGL